MRPEDPLTAQSRASRRSRIGKLDMRKHAERMKNSTGNEELDPPENRLGIRFLARSGLYAAVGEIVPQFKPSTNLHEMQLRLKESQQGVFDASWATPVAAALSIGSTLSYGSEIGLATIAFTGLTALYGYRLVKFKENVGLYSGHIDSLQPLETPETKPDAAVPFRQIEHHTRILQDPAASLELKVDSRTWLQSLHNFTGQVLDRWRPSQGATRPQIKPPMSEGPKHD